MNERKKITEGNTNMAEDVSLAFGGAKLCWFCEHPFPPEKQGQRSILSKMKTPRSYSKLMFFNYWKELILFCATSCVRIRLFLPLVRQRFEKNKNESKLFVFIPKTDGTCFSVGCVSSRFVDSASFKIPGSGVLGIIYKKRGLAIKIKKVRREPESFWKKSWHRSMNLCPFLANLYKYF